MKYIKTPIDKELKDFTLEELSLLQWKSVGNSEYQNCTDRELRFCDPMYLVRNRSIIKEQSTEFYLYTLHRCIRNVIILNSGYYSILHDVIRDFVPRHLWKEMLHEFIEMMNIYTLGKSFYFDSTKSTMVWNGVMNINFTPIRFSYLSESTNTLSIHISSEDWMEMYEKTNYLYYAFSNDNLPEMLPLMVTSEQIEGFGFPKVPDLIASEFTKHYNVQWDYDAFHEYKLDSPRDVYTWNELLSEFYSGKVDGEVLREYWMYVWYLYYEHKNADPDQKLLKSLKKPVSTEYSEKVK